MVRPGYRAMSIAFLLGVITLVFGAFVQRFTGVAIVTSGALFVTAGAMVLLDIGGAGTGSVERRRRWQRRWLPWVESSKTHDRAIMAFTGGLAIIGGIVFAIFGVAVLIGRT